MGNRTVQESKELEYKIPLSVREFYEVRQLIEERINRLENVGHRSDDSYVSGEIILLRGVIHKLDDAAEEEAG